MSANRCVMAIASMAACGVALAQPSYDLAPVGPTDAMHTRSDGYRHSEAIALNESGQVLGTADRFVGQMPFGPGKTAFLYSGSTTRRIGLEDAEHLGSDGMHGSSAVALNEAGQAIGNSSRFANGGGRSAFFYDGSGTRNIGLVDAAHTRSDGYRWSEVLALSESGHVLGAAQIFNGGSMVIGQSSFLFHGQTTLILGLTDAEHTRSDGQQVSTANRLNASGRVLGHSERYSGMNYNGLSAFLYDGTRTLEIGFTDVEHTSISGYRHNGARALNNAGQVIGESDRYGGTAFLQGRTAYLFDGQQTIDIGLVDAAHTRSDGYRSSHVSELNEAGQAMGSSARPTTGGQSTFLFNGTTTLDISPKDAEHTRSDGLRSSHGAELNGKGHVLGFANRYLGTQYLGQSVFLYDGVSTLNIGLTDSEHTRGDGHRMSTYWALNESGQAIGNSERYLGNASAGQSAFVYDGSRTVNIGFKDARHTRADGHRHSTVVAINDAGQVVGYSVRYGSFTEPSATSPIFYDSATGRTYDLTVTQRPDGYASGRPEFLGEDGLVLGTYDLGAEKRAFMFTIATGSRDLGALVAGGLTAKGWSHLADAVRANGRGYIIGTGLLSNVFEAKVAYILKPIGFVAPPPPAPTPVPAAAASGDSGGGGSISLVECVALLLLVIFGGLRRFCPPMGRHSIRIASSG